jgi:amidase
MQNGFLPSRSPVQEPYKGAATAITDVLSGPTRSPELPNVPTMIESGYPGFVSMSWTGIVAPAGTPPEIVAKISKVEGSYTKYLDQGALNGARIGILRESIGNQSDPNAPDFNIVDAAFEKNVAELKAAGAIPVDPIVITNLKRLLATRERNPIETDAALELYLARNPGSPFKNRQDIISSPDIDKSFPPPNVARYKAPSAPLNAERYVEYVRARDELMISIAKIMADNKLDAIVHKSVEHEPSLIKNGINPPYETTRGVPTLNTFLIFAASMTVPSGSTSNDLPVGITFFGLPYSEPMLLKLGYSYEQATHHRVPPKMTPALPK